MPIMRGTVDGRRRPVLTIATRDGSRFLGMIDTGFNGELWMSQADAMALGVDYDEVYTEPGFAVGMRPIDVARGKLVIFWLGQERVVDALVDIDSTHRTSAAGEPMALIGTELLDPALLSINFENRTCAVRGR